MPESNGNTSERIDYYDDKDHDYRDFWVGRDYEHLSEVLAIKRLLQGKHFKLALDFGGGYGRLVPVIQEFADRVILADPSTKQLNFAKKYLKEFEGQTDYALINSSHLVPADDGAIDLLIMVRVSHHLPVLDRTFNEIYRALKPGGEAIIEIANEAHFINRLRYMKKLKSVPKQPVEVGKRANGIVDSTPFVNHNPATVAKIFKEHGFIIENKLSVSNLRQSYLKKHIKVNNLLAFEKLFQSSLSGINFGPSIFFLVKKR